MKICLAQTRPVKGDVQSNIERHKIMIDLAVSDGAEMIIFPELSITGYEPELAKELATTENDDRFDDFQKISDANQITIGIGAPLKQNAGISISMIFFQPQLARTVYSKKYLHADEEAFFVSVQSSIGLIGGEARIAPAICYELMVPEHSAAASENGAKIYLTSVANTAQGVERATASLSAIAEKYAMTALMANCVGRCDNFVSAGSSAVWNDKGLLVGQLNDTSEGILTFDTETQEMIEKPV